MTGALVEADAAILGAGAAGLSLLAHLGAAGWHGTVAVVDDGSHQVDGRSWAWWSRGDMLLDADATASFTRALCAGVGWERNLDLAPFAYRAITGEALRAACERRAAPSVLIRRVAGRAFAVDGGTGVFRCEVASPGGQTEVVAPLVFDSVGIEAGRIRARSGPHLDFLGWHVRCEHEAFEPGLLTLMDFRTDQSDGVAFVYVLPTSAREALVERTVFVVRPGGAPLDHEPRLRAYLDGVCGAGEIQVVGLEQGAIALGTPRDRAARATLIGTPAGAIKMSTGYAFERIQRHSAALAARATGSAATVPTPASGAWFAALDRALLALMRVDPTAARRFLEAMLRRLPAPWILRFLDERLPLSHQLVAFARLPVWLFARAMVRAALRRGVSLGS